MSHGIESPAFKAALVYKRELCGRTFEQDLQIHLVNGFVVATPDYFIMGRPVCSQAPHYEIVDCTFPFPPEEQDCWHIHCMAGDLRKCWDFYPFQLPFVSWEKRNRLRFYRMEQIKQMICHD